MYHVSSQNNQLIQLAFAKKFITPRLKLEMQEADLTWNGSEFYNKIKETILNVTVLA